MARGARFPVLSLVLLSLFPAPGGTQEAPPPGFYLVADYDPARDPFADLAAATERAGREGKRILLEVGGRWCGWCRVLDLYIRDHPAVADRLEKGYLVVKVNWSSENKNQAFLSRYPSIGGYPHLFVLDQDGSLLHSQSTGDLEEGRSYNEEVFLAFLDKWKPPAKGRLAPAPPPFRGP